jgi:ATP-dependent RNA circularization protein (DNA/RNA ligase family)
MSCKYPKTPHLYFSPCINDDDVQLDPKTCSQFVNREIIITEKLDGGNCQLHQGKVYARTNSKEATHASFSAIKQIYSQFSFLVEDNLSLFGENMFGIHSIEYSDLESYFYLFGVFDNDTKKWASWDKILEYAKEYDIPHVPVLFEGKFNSLDEIKNWMTERMKSKSTISQTGPEGFVLRIREEYDDGDFEKSCAKYVRNNHIQTDETWNRTWKQAKLIKK